MQVVQHRLWVVLGRSHLHGHDDGGCGGTPHAG